ncbi:MAG: DNA mismatch repair protein MutS [Mycolicibacterium sp.]|nr:DNA mismatch repair protein MutS [Mycolicibacterium sp.]
MFRSILYTGNTDGPECAEPDCLADLHLDDVISAIGRHDDDELHRMYRCWARDVDEVAYRHEVFRDLSSGVREPVTSFVDGIGAMRGQLATASALMHPLGRQGWQLDAMSTYLRAVVDLHTALSTAEPSGRGLSALCDYLDCYRRSEAFTSLERDTVRVREELGAIRYSLHIKGLRLEVDQYRGEPEYSDQVAELFSRFRRGAVRDYRISYPSYPGMSGAEEQILDRVAKLFPDQFAALAAHCRRYPNVIDPTLSRFATEVRFYLAYLRFMDRFTDTAHNRFCYPTVTAEAGRLDAEGAYDLALATKGLPDQACPVTNEVRLGGAERIVIVTGPNQGGKTTLARTIGQLAYLSALGCPVPAARATVTLPDAVFTHFERQERVASLHGKLDDELLRIRDILARASARSVIVMNESFASTSLSDALAIGTDVLHRIIGIGCIAVYVSFLDELSRLDPACVSMVGGVDPADPTARTFRFGRRRADGLAHADALATKYGLAPDVLRRRVSR